MHVPHMHIREGSAVSIFQFLKVNGARNNTQNPSNVIDTPQMCAPSRTQTRGDLLCRDALLH